MTISVVVTCYNYARYLDVCLQSVLSQTWRDLEVVVVNDGSIDDTADVARRWLKDSRLKYVEQANAGQANAKNVGVRATTGALIAFLDADDFWLPDKLARQHELFANPAVGVVYSRTGYVDEQGSDRGDVLLVDELKPRRGRVTEAMLFDNFVPFSSSVVRRSAFERVGGFDESLQMAIDWDLWLRISLDHEFDYVDAPLLRYRMGHSDQMSNNREMRVACCDRILNRFLDRHRADLPNSVVRDALAYTYANRGRHLAERDRPRAVRYFLRSLRHRPLHRPAYVGLIRSVLRLP